MNFVIIFVISKKGRLSLFANNKKLNIARIKIKHVIKNKSWLLFN